MSSAQPWSSLRGVKKLENSPVNDVFPNVPTFPVPAPREIPLPEFYPRERTSTASFKAPITSASKKKTEVPPPPPPGTLTTAMGYITTPVKYISTMFYASPAPAKEPPKTKEKLFKIDLEREREKVMSPKLPAPTRKIQNVIVEEVIPQTKTSQPPEKSQGSVWRRKNMMDYGTDSPLSPKPASKVRGQSIKRATPSSSPALETTSPLSFNQVKISSSLNQNSFKVVSKFPQEDPQKLKKKETRKGTNQRPQKEVQAVNNSNKVNSRYQLNSPTKLIAPLPKDEYPIFPHPTILPPRVPPPSYTIRSSQSSKSKGQGEEIYKEKEADMIIENKSEDNLSTAIATTTDRPELVSFPSPTILRPFTAAGENESASADGEEEFQLHETLGKADMGEVARLSRLDQLPSGRLTDASSLKNLFHDAKLVNNSLNNASISDVFPNGRVGAMRVQLCSTTTHNISPTGVGLNKQYLSPSRSLGRKTSPLIREAEISPVKKPAAVPITISSRTREPQPVTVSSTNAKEEVFKRYPVQSSLPGKPSQLSERTSSKEIVLNSLRSKSPSPGANEYQGKNSPLRVEDKYITAVAEKLGKQQDERRSRYSSWVKSHGKGEKEQSSLGKTKPHVIIKNGKYRSPEKPKTSSPLNSAIIGATVTAAATAVSAALQSVQDNDRGSVLSQSDHTTKDDNKERKRSPSSWKMENNKLVEVVPLAPRSTSKTKEEQIIPRSTSKTKEEQIIPRSNSKTKEEQIIPRSNSKTKEEQIIPRSNSKTKEEQIIPRSNSKTKQEQMIPRSTSKSKVEQIIPPAKENPFMSEPKPKRSLSSGAKDFIKNTILNMVKEDNLKVSTKETSNPKPGPQKTITDGNDEFSCLENYCGDPSKFFKAATMMGEIP
ncbi:hypothetical protein RRG08_044392 [Elysia crispata]|uniref:Uncharacterized protein n=1 Tax=Elysia crispata TaxID=231223 RepID=A0AAE1DNK6_9GAST|nr:hypothetical protein RRG08_044392 [Elysia crispata]